MVRDGRESLGNMTEPLFGQALRDAIIDLQVEDPKSERVLVLSPHPDDDVIGCGGTLARLVVSGSDVTVLYLTDGAKGDPTGTYAKSQLVELRKREAREASYLLGVQNLIFLGYPDGQLRADEETVKRVSVELNACKPELVYLPSFFEGIFHPDHLQANAILDRIVSEGEGDFTCWSYETHTPLIPNRLVDITSQAASKQRAIEQHKTQMLVRPYSKILKLNEYRAAFLGTPGGGEHYVEAFLKAAPTIYFGLLRSFLQNSSSGETL
jgi:LmbE family N-acetylglucosaminyl deacetylase